MGHTIKIHTPPYPPNLLFDIARFHHHEPGWSTTETMLHVGSPVYACIRDDTNDHLLAVGSLSSHCPNTYWLGNIMVAQRLRRTGLGSAVVTALEKIAASEQKRPYIALFASPFGAPLYTQLGYTTLSSTTAVCYQREGGLPLPPPSAMSASAATAADLLAVTTLDANARGLPPRPALLEQIFTDSNICAVVQASDGARGVAWARRTAALSQGGPAGVLIAPVVADRADIAIAVTVAVLRMAAEKYGDGLKATVLSLEKDGSEESQLVFESIGFVRQFPLPVMWKKVGNDVREDRVDDMQAYLGMKGKRYYAAAGYELG